MKSKNFHSVPKKIKLEEYFGLQAIISIGALISLAGIFLFPVTIQLLLAAFVAGQFFRLVSRPLRRWYGYQKQIALPSQGVWIDRLMSILIILVIVNLYLVLDFLGYGYNFLRDLEPVQDFIVNLDLESLKNLDVFKIIRGDESEREILFQIAQRVGGVVGTIVTIFTSTTFFISMMILLTVEARLAKTFKQIIFKNGDVKFGRSFLESNLSFIKWIGLQLISSILFFIICYITFLFAGNPKPVQTSLIIASLDFIPFLGTSAATGVSVIGGLNSNFSLVMLIYPVSKALFENLATPNAMRKWFKVDQALFLFSLAAGSEAGSSIFWFLPGIFGSALGGILAVYIAILIGNFYRNYIESAEPIPSFLE